MKQLWILCVLYFSACALAQTTAPRDKFKEPRLEDIRVDVDSEGRFTTSAGTKKQMGTLKVSDLPSSNDPPLALETTIKCTTFEALVVENEKRGGAFSKMVPSEVLSAVFPAASSCLARNLLSLRDNMHDFVIADIGAMVDAQIEIDQRKYNDLVDRYNQLVEKHNALLAVTRNFATQLATTQSELGRQQQVNKALAIYQLMPKYTPPQTINIQVTDCTRLPALCMNH